MATLKKYKPKNEKELHTIIEKELDSLEEGLKLLRYEMSMGTGIPDFLCVDSGGRLTIIEVKLNEDELALFQALRYYFDINKHRYAIARMFSKYDINPEEDPRIILIAETFSSNIIKVAALVKPDVELYEYTVVIDSKGNKGIVFHPRPILKIEELPTKPISIDEHINYITDDKLKKLLNKIIDEIKNIGQDIVIHPTQYYIGFKYKGRLFAYIETYRKAFDIWVPPLDDEGHIIKDADYDYTRIENAEQDYSEIMKKIKEDYVKLGGKLYEES